MKFGKKLAAAAHPEWAHAYVQYKKLKQAVKLLRHAETAAQAEGMFMGQLMSSIQQARFSRVWAPARAKHPALFIARSLRACPFLSKRGRVIMCGLHPHDTCARATVAAEPVLHRP